MGVSNFLNEAFGYQTGAYQGYDLETTGDKFLAKLDWNINDQNKFSLRFNRLDSESDNLISNTARRPDRHGGVHLQSGRERCQLPEYQPGVGYRNV